MLCPCSGTRKRGTEGLFQIQLHARVQPHLPTLPAGCHDRAVLLYEYVGKRIVDLQHTEVPDAYRGRGIAKHLAKVGAWEGSCSPHGGDPPRRPGLFPRAAAVAHSQHLSGWRLVLGRGLQGHRHLLRVGSWLAGPSIQQVVGAQWTLW